MKPNVLFLVVDDLRPQLGCYGRTQMITPHIDSLAARGVRLDRAYCQVPVCGASRCSVLTGMRPTRRRFLDYASWADEDLPGAVTLPEHFRNHGYTTLSDGKVFHHRLDTAERSWSDEPWHPNRPGGGRWRNYQTPENIARAQEHEGRGPAYECADVGDEAYFDGQIADRAVADLNRLVRDGGPWFLGVGFIKPHLPFSAPRRYWDLYDADRVHLADNPFPPEAAPSQALHNSGELRSYFDVPDDGPLSEELVGNLVHGYYAATSYADAQVGKVLDELQRLGQRDNTVVVFWGDHGWQLGEHGLWCKHCNFNTSLNAPLIVSAPDAARGDATDRLVEFVDMYPTLCELCGLPEPEALEGASFAPLLDGTNRPWKSGAFARWYAGESIRTDRYLYTEWTDESGAVQARMCYDHDADPDENRNIAERDDLSETMDDLSRRLRDGWRAAAPG
ncbi:MAG: sulfatase [Planctomycetota bacterium]